jgi:hypothetical protein
VDVRDRLLKSQGLGHNKFVVLTRGGAPEKVLTGSANWSPTGLCTQVNDAVSFADPAVAAIYLRQWEALAAAGSGFPPALVAGNAASPQAAPGGVGVWFTRVRDGSKKGDPPGADLQALVELVERARSMVLFVMFQPGKEPLTTLARRAGEGLFVRGVVNQAPGGFGWGGAGGADGDRAAGRGVGGLRGVAEGGDAGGVPAVAEPGGDRARDHALEGAGDRPVRAGVRGGDGVAQLLAERERGERRELRGGAGGTGGWRRRTRWRAPGCGTTTGGGPT